MDKNCQVEPLNKTPTLEEQRMTTTALLAVECMGCPYCAARVRNGLLGLTGVINVQVALEAGLAEVT